MKTLDDWTVAPFGPSAFDRDSSAPRQNFEIRVTGSALQMFEDIDEWAEHYISQHSKRLFDKDAEQVSYRPLLSHRHAEPLLRTKISMPSAPWPTRIWSPDGALVPFPEGLTWSEALIQAKVHISHLWVTDCQCGLVVNLKDLCYRGGAAVFPFAGKDGEA